MTVCAVAFTCQIWLAKLSSPSAPTNAVSANTSGSRAATIAPKVRSRTASVIGIARYSARWKSLSSASLSAASELAPPNSSTRTDGFRSPTADTASRIGPIFWSDASGSPVRSKVTRDERPSAETSGAPDSGLATFVTFGVRPRVSTRSASAVEAASEVAPWRRWTRTISDAGSFHPCASRICCACAVGPTSPSARVISPREIRLPSTIARATQPSQPKTAVFRCRALHRPARAARLRDDVTSVSLQVGRAAASNLPSGGARAHPATWPVGGRASPITAAESLAAGRPEPPSGKAPIHPWTRGGGGLRGLPGPGGSGQGGLRVDQAGADLLAQFGGVLVPVLVDGVHHGGVEDLGLLAGDRQGAADLAGHRAAVDHLAGHGGAHFLA